MKQILSFVLAFVLILGMIPLNALATETEVALEESTNIPSGTVLRCEQYIRDPFILVDNGVYYMYGSIAYGQFEVFSSTDLKTWTTYSQPAYKAAENSWVHEAAKQPSSAGVETGYWAPEVFKLTIGGETAYYMIATFTQNKAPYSQQVSAIMKADNPLGPFTPWSVDENGDIAPITPNDGCSYMDATLYYEDGVPYLVYVHEWQCSCRNYDGIGSMGYVQLSDDLKTVVGGHKEWFQNRLLYAYNTDLFQNNVPGVTDGPEIYTDKNGQHYLLWSTHFLDKYSGEQVYVELATKFSKLGETKLLTMKKDTLLLYANNGGHGMIFTDLSGNEKMVLHTPSNSEARASIFDVKLTSDGIALDTYTVSGTVAGELNGTVTATNTDRDKHIFKYALKNGNYQLDLPNGTYNLYFDCGHREGVITGVTVNGAAATAPVLQKTYQKLTAYKDGISGTANWVLTANGRYEVKTSNTNVNAVSMGYFADGVDMATTDFVIQTDVEANGTNAVMIGLAISGKNAAGKTETAVFGLNNANNTAQIRVMNENLWPGYKGIGSYDRTNFHLTVVKEGTTITYYIDGIRACQWTTSDYDFGSWKETKVGIGFYRMFDVTFSDYSYSSDPNDVANVHKRTVTYSQLPAGVSVSAEGEAFESGAYLDLGTKVQISYPENRANEYLVTVNGEIVQMEKGMASFVVSENTQITVTYSANGHLIIRDLYAWINYPVSDFYPQFTKPENAEALTYTYDTDALIIDPEKQTVKALQPGAYAVTASSGKFSATFTVYAEAVDKYAVGGNGEEKYYAQKYEEQVTDRHQQWINAGDEKTTIFIGDSFFDTVYWSDFYSQSYPGKNALCLGIASSTTYDWETWAQGWLRETNPENIVIHIGTNNVYDDGDSQMQTISALRRLFTVIHSQLRDTNIYWFGISQRSYDDARISLVADVNKDMQQWCDERDYITYIDTPSRLTTDMLRDGIHPKLEYYSIFTEELAQTDIVIADSRQEGQRLTIQKVGSDGTANWIQQDDGSYQVQTSNTNVNSVSYGYFTDGVDLAVTDFVIKTRVQSAGTNAVMIGMVIGKDDEAVVYGLNNANYSAQIRALQANGWPGYRNVASYDRTDFELTIVKKGTTVTYYIDGVQACQWTKADYDFTSWTNAKVGIGFYRMFDVTFSDYSYTVTTETTSCQVCGTVAGNANGHIRVTDSQGNSRTYENALENGRYQLELMTGTYSLYFDCGATEGMISGINVIGVDMEVPCLEKTYQKLTAYKYGTDGTANWVLVDNGQYEVQTSNASNNSITMGYFADGVNLTNTDFVIKTRVQTSGTKPAMIGLVICKNNEAVVYGLNNSNYSAQIRVLQANGWPGYKNVPSYDRTDFELTIVKKGTTVTYYIDGVQACQWTSSDYNFSSWSNAMVGIGFYRMYDVTFSDYSYVETKAEVSKWNLVLDDDLKVNYHLNLDSYTAADAKVNITVDGNTVSYNAADLDMVDGLRVASVELAAAQMNDDITVSVVKGDKTLFSKTFTVRDYCYTVLADEDYSAYHTLIKEMLAYGGAAQTYFGHNNASEEDLANYGITDTGAYDIPETAKTEMVISGEADGIAFYGASLVFRDKIAVRFYFTGSSEGIEGAVDKGDMFYIEVADILPQNLDEAVTVTVNGLTVSYSPMNYMVRMNEKGSDNLQALLKALYNYHLAAKALRTF